LSYKLSTVEIDNLWKLFKDNRDIDAKNELLLHYNYLVKWIVSRIEPQFSNRADYDDLVCCGMIGLTNAVDTYDKEQYSKFDEYAAKLIRDEIHDNSRLKDWASPDLREKINDFYANGFCVHEFWQEFLSSGNLDASTEYIECFHFELTEEWANKLLALVLEGKKKATAGSLHYFEKTSERLPRVGDYSIVTDWDGNPRCVIKTTAVTILPFNEITFDICKREGEDETLESWQEGHRHFFTEDGKEVGYEFSETMPVVFEDFEVVYRR